MGSKRTKATPNLSATCIRLFLPYLHHLFPLKSSTFSLMDVLSPPSLRYTPRSRPRWDTAQDGRLRGDPAVQYLSGILLKTKDLGGIPPRNTLGACSRKKTLGGAHCARPQGELVAEDLSGILLKTEDFGGDPAAQSGRLLKMEDLGGIPLSNTSVGYCSRREDLSGSLLKKERRPRGEPIVQDLSGKLLKKEDLGGSPPTKTAGGSWEGL
ncbi:hypothetical protein C8R43DRAFT_1155594 [Mycena crocata]|nr:hypothetical protein C8R43DRAFT_1155594 [Mycena crocata]